MVIEIHATAAAPIGTRVQHCTGDLDTWNRHGTQWDPPAILANFSNKSRTQWDTHAGVIENTCKVSHSLEPVCTPATNAAPIGSRVCNGYINNTCNIGGTHWDPRLWWAEYTCPGSKRGSHWDLHMNPAKIAAPIGTRGCGGHNDYTCNTIAPVWTRICGVHIDITCKHAAPIGTRMRVPMGATAGAGHIGYCGRRETWNSPGLQPLGKQQMPSTWMNWNLLAARKTWDPSQGLGFQAWDMILMNSSSTALQQKARKDLKKL
ncbi:hypothetical protein EDD22DRAFT_853740 [Suillus occidentalis]|nr:hypothetical protein EDD22DRAFT_853740 [Suillus occidentalis]